jgi:hypothetical protein
VIAMRDRRLSSMRTSSMLPGSLAALLSLASACAAAKPATSPTPTGTAAKPIAATVTAASPARAETGISTAPQCGHPSDIIGVCSISEAGVTIQARNLRPGATAAVQLDGDYATRVGCRRRWHQELTVDAGGVVTARYDIPARDRCALLAAMVVAVYVLPAGPDLGPIRFGTNPPP